MGSGNFKIGDIATITCRRHGHGFVIGEDVRITQVLSDHYRAEPVNAHPVAGPYVKDSELKPKNRITTIIYLKDRETIAILKDGDKVIKSAKAICNPNDEFNAEYGAKLAFARLLGLGEQVTEILLNGVKEFREDGNFKARCVESSDSGLTVGKIYEFKNGYSNWNDGTRLPQFKKNGISRFRSFADLEKWFDVKGISKFEEVIERSIPSGLPTTAPQVFDWDGFKSGKFAVHCDTEEKAKSFLWECENQGMLWKCGEKPTIRTRWETYNKLTCYSCIRDKGKLTYGDIPFHESNRPVIDYTPNFHEVKRPAKVGEWIKVVNANRVPTTNGKNDYKNGDILKVLDTEWSGNKPRYADGYGDNGYARILNYEEYVVLESIAPATEEPKPLDLSGISMDVLFEELRKRVK